MAVLKRVLVCDLKDVFSSQPNLDKRLRPDGYALPLALITATTHSTSAIATRPL
jgi:hypothetical protein